MRTKTMRIYDAIEQDLSVTQVGDEVMIETSLRESGDGFRLVLHPDDALALARAILQGCTRTRGDR